MNADKIAAILLEANPPKDRIVAFGNNVPAGGFFANNQQELDKVYAEAGFARPAAILSAVGNDLRLQGADRLYLKREELDKILRFLGADFAEKVTVIGKDGVNRPESIENVLLAPSDAQAEKRRENKQIQAQQSKYAPPQQPAPAAPAAAPANPATTPAPAAPAPATPATPATRQARAPQGTRQLVTRVLDVHGGVMVHSRRPGGPLARAGIKKGDILHKINYTRIQDKKHFHNLIDGLVPRVPYTLTFVRHGKTDTTKISVEREEA